jgi:peptidoglycan-N-acetylglucosamine deacetylase
MWLDYGFELGNHTFSHASLNQIELKDWEDEVVQGESVTRMLLAQHKMKLRYFRHPYLDTGRDLATRRKAEEFLTQRGYRIAPITLDGWDWMFAGLYEDAKKRNDTAFQQQIVKEYLAHHDASIAYAEQLSVKVLGYEPKQILLLHASNLEADHMENCSTFCASADTDSSLWKMRWAIKRTACPIRMSVKKAQAGSNIGRSRRGRSRRALQKCPSG